MHDIGRIYKMDIRTASLSNPIIWTANYLQIRPNVRLKIEVKWILLRTLLIS